MEIQSSENQSYALFVCVPFIGHLNPLLRQAEELAQRGWRVSIASFEPIGDYIKKNFPAVHFISVGEPLATLEEAEAFLARVSEEKSWLKSTLLLLGPLEDFWSIMFDSLLNEVRRDRPDVMVIDFVSTAGLDVAEIENIPYVINNPDLLTVLPATLLPFTASAPQLFSGHSVHKMGPLQKISAYIIRALGIAIAQLTINRRTNKMRSTRGLSPVDHLRRLKGRTILVNCVFGLEYERPIPSWIHMTGPIFTKAMLDLPEDWNSWLNNGLPVVYVNLGTLASPSTEQLQRMSSAFNSDRFRVLWVMRKSISARLPEDLPANVRIENWVPSPTAILSHSNVFAFVSHCGVNSVHESIEAGTPIIAIPMFAAQYDMGMRVKDASVGLLLDKTSFTPKELHNAIVELLQNQQFRKNISAIKKRFREAGGVQRAADLITVEARLSERSATT